MAYPVMVLLPWGKVVASKIIRGDFFYAFPWPYLPSRTRKIFPAGISFEKYLEVSDIF
jgi:hypothetical protein